MNLEMREISKSFGPVNALKSVSFTLGAGEIHGLLGENGAGKSTLMNILAGTFPPTSGEIFINDEAVHKMNPHKSASLGIRFIHQELNLCNDLRVYQNLFLGQELTKNGFVNKKEEIRRAQEVLDYMKTNIRADMLVSELETAQKQLVEIARALLFKSEIIIMDEPTTALNSHEIAKLFDIMRALKAEGVSFIYISHKMPEIFEICDKYTVLRDGGFIQTGEIKDIDEKQATELLIGKSFTHTNLKEGSTSSVTPEVLLSVSKLTGTSCKNISFDLHRGEVIVFTGLQGSGTDELATMLFGASPISSGSVMLHDNSLSHKNIKSVMKAGIAMVPKNRKERGIVPDLSIQQNCSLAYFTAKHDKPFISDPEERARFERNREKMEIRVGSAKDAITSLSGGNQQKVIIGKWLEIDADVYILDNPTQGIDVGAKFAIYELIHEIVRTGKAAIVFSSEFPEISQLADRCFVLYKGEVQGVLPYSELSEVKMMEYSTGAQ
ncbi:MAG: sugar ABC transporter ATP-binding protein [Deferribacteraceae bacterium]|jgi:ribose transport system ATP-binding protein|nr:sugar ABC transporter ATP-binding protein [Deferribacteraceae bacterium]